MSRFRSGGAARTPYWAASPVCRPQPSFGTGDGRWFGLRDDRWERIKDLLSGREGSVGVTAAVLLEAALYCYRAGMPWRDLPERFGDWTKVHLQFSRCAQSGVREQAFQHLAVDADNEPRKLENQFEPNNAGKESQRTPSVTFRRPTQPLAHEYCHQIETDRATCIPDGRSERS